MAKGANIAEKVEALIRPCISELGYRIWDVEYVKEGTEWYLRVTLDSDSGIGIDDCERVSRAINPIIDEANPIEDFYYLEVSSPGIERVLRSISRRRSAVMWKSGFLLPMKGKRKLTAESLKPMTAKPSRFRAALKR